MQAACLYMSKHRLKMRVDCKGLHLRYFPLIWQVKNENDVNIIKIYCNEIFLVDS